MATHRVHLMPGLISVKVGVFIYLSQVETYQRTYHEHLGSMRVVDKSK